MTYIAVTIISNAGVLKAELDPAADPQQVASELASILGLAGRYQLRLIGAFNIAAGAQLELVELEDVPYGVPPESQRLIRVAEYREQRLPSPPGLDNFAATKRIGDRTRYAAALVSCDQMPYLRSVVSDEPVAMMFVNGTGHNVNLSWVDFEGRAQQKAMMVPGQHLEMLTHMTHPWLACGPSGRCLAVFLPTTKSCTAVIT